MEMNNSNTTLPSETPHLKNFPTSYNPMQQAFPTGPEKILNKEPPFGELAKKGFHFLLPAP